MAGFNAYTLWNEHWEHWSHMPPLEERTEYPYQNIRSRNFPWGDGDKVCCPRDASFHDSCANDYFRPSCTYPDAHSVLIPGMVS